MESMRPAPLAPRAVRQLRRIRTVYAAGLVLWAAGAAWEGGQHPGSRRMWVSLMLLAVFGGLLSFTVASLWRHRVALRLRVAARRARSGARPAKVAAARSAGGRTTAAG
ncbi:hypothetical protein [Streptomyces antarcticus]|uniref:hypothetical protein n=1 Tax=Streptomyces antarcticus TaxID=2996458 RepID=UPI00226D4FC1|nr:MULTISPECIES: hypothetical protein [unclassified Streptomyces]MCY0943109.1 hypothetical protein [Streptomyces sp. H34-AA3]